MADAPMTAAERQARERKTQKRQAHAERMRAEGIDPSQLGVAKQHLRHLRVACQLLRVFAHDEDTHDVAASTWAALKCRVSWKHTSSWKTLPTTGTAVMFGI